MSYLPLNTDKIEGNTQHEFLLDILTKNPSILIKDVNDLKLVCEIFAKFVQKRKDREYKEEVAKTKQALMVVKDWSFFKENVDYLWASLTTSQRNILVTLMNSP
jgi:hypothetical protein